MRKRQEGSRRVHNENNGTTPETNELKFIRETLLTLRKRTVVENRNRNNQNLVVISLFPFPSPFSSSSELWPREASSDLGAPVSEMVLVFLGCSQDVVGVLLHMIRVLRMWLPVINTTCETE